MFKGFVAICVLFLVSVWYSYSTAEAGPLGLFGRRANSACANGQRANGSCAPASVAVQVAPATITPKELVPNPRPDSKVILEPTQATGCPGSAASGCAGAESGRRHIFPIFRRHR